MWSRCCCCVFYFFAKKATLLLLLLWTTQRLSSRPSCLPTLRVWPIHLPHAQVLYNTHLKREYMVFFKQKHTGKQQSNGRLNFARRQRRLFVVTNETTRFGRDTFENIVHERIHNRHCSTRNAGIRMHLTQYFVNIRRVCLNRATTPKTTTLALNAVVRFGVSFLRHTLREGFWTRSKGRKHEPYVFKKILYWNEEWVFGSLDMCSLVWHIHHTLTNDYIQTQSNAALRSTQCKSKYLLSFVF